jgi:hypothetical protein
MFTQSNTTFSSYKMENDMSFGTIQFHVSDVPSKSAEFNIAMIIDNSSSMDDSCDQDGRKRMQYAKFTAEQLCRKAQENATGPIKVSLTTFDTNVVSVFGMQELTADTVGTMASQISTIYPNGSTDIGAVFTEIQKMAHVQPEFIAFVLTDGQATSGERNVQKLIEHACKIPNAVQLELIGYGADHDFKLLKGIQQARTNTGYRFIAEFEKSAFACSEIIYRLLNRLAKYVRIYVTHGEIYNWKNNTWTSEIDIDNLVTNMNKTYAVRSSDPTQFKATICGVCIETNEQFEYGISDEPLPLDNLTKEWLRNKTMQTIYEVGQIDYDALKRTERMAKQQNAKQKLTDLMVEIKKYMDDTRLKEDKMLTMLCDDIFTCHETIGIRNGNMYIHARQSSQGTQSIYNVEPPKARHFDPTNFESIPKLSRSLSVQVDYMKARQPIEIFIKTLDNITFMLPTSIHHSIELVINMISEQIRIHPSKIPLVFNGKEVDYYGTLESNGIKNGDILEIVIGVPNKPHKEDDLEDIQITRKPVIRGHTMSLVEDSPYAELSAIQFMRGTSIKTPTNNI